MKKIVEEIAQGRTLVSDGAWGTFLQKKGLEPGHCPELWNIERPQDVLDIARSYVEAGSHMIETNSFGGSPVKLEHYGLEKRTAEINSAAARISREAAGYTCHVLGSIGPTGKIAMTGDITEQAFYDGFARQAVALYEGGADAICVETMSAIDEACCAIRAVKENTLAEIVCTFTFERTVDGTYRTMMGVSPQDMVAAVVDAGADIVGANCGNGLERMIEITAEIRASNSSIPILIHANAGMPRLVDGENVFPESPANMAALIPACVKAGANIIGGCCGTTPDHIRAIKTAMDRQ